MLDSLAILIIGRAHAMQPSQSSLGIEIAFLGLLALLWGSAYLFTKVAVTDIPPITLVAVRASIGALFLFGVMSWRSERLPRDRKTWRMLFIQAFLSSFGAWTILAWGQQYIDSGLASVLNSTSPIFVFFITLLFTQHESVSTLKLVGACLGLIGVVLIVGFEALQGLGQQVAGQLAALTGALLYAGAAIYGKKFSHLSATVTATGTMIWTAIIMVPLSLLLEQPWALQPSLKAVSATIILSVFCTGVGLLIYFRLINTLGSMGVASQAYLRAGVGVMLGILFLGEQITLIVGIGLAAAILGVIAINFPTKSK